MSAKRGLGAQPQEKLPLIHIRHVRKRKVGFGGAAPRKTPFSFIFGMCASAKRGLGGAAPEKNSPLIHIRHVRECKAGFGGRSPREKLPSYSYSIEYFYQ